jgi:hypothetical protein
MCLGGRINENTTLAKMQIYPAKSEKSSAVPEK